MKSSKAIRWLRKQTVPTLALGIWLAGWLWMATPTGDALMRVSYDFLNRLLTHQPDPKVMVIAVTDQTFQRLNLPLGKPLNRNLQAELLNKVQKAGVVQVCYDVHFAWPGSNPEYNDAFIAAIKEYGHVILGARIASSNYDGPLQVDTETDTTTSLFQAAKGWGLINVGIVDPDNVVRRMHTSMDGHPALAVVTAAEGNSAPATQPDQEKWLYYQAMPGDIPTRDFADFFEPNWTPDDKLHGAIVFIGAESSSTASGTHSHYPTPFTQNGARDIYDVEWQANAYVNAARDFWFSSAGPLWATFWCLPCAVLPWFFLGRFRTRWVVAGWLVGAVVLAVTALFLIVNDQVIFNWLVPPVVQFPAGLLAVAVWKLLNNRHYDVFISYRRKGGRHLALLVHNALEDRGFSVFMDHKLPSGKFDVNLLRRIEKATHMIVILSAGALDDSQNENNWMRWEIRHAFKLDKNVVPVMDVDVKMPEFATLPQDIAKLSQQNGIELTHLFEPGMDQLVSILNSHAANSFKEGIQLSK